MSLVTKIIPQSTNFVVNPSWEHGTSGWTAHTGTGITYASARTSGVWWYAGGDAETAGYSYQFQITGAPGGGNLSNYIWADTTISVAPGQSVAIAARSMVTDARLIPWLAVRFFTAGGALISTVTEAQTASTPTVTREHRLSAVAPATADHFALDLRFSVSEINASGFFGYWDGIDCRIDAQLDTFISGDEPGCRWSGTPGNSTSIRDAVTLTEVLGTGQGGVTTIKSRVYAADKLNNLGTELTDHFVAGTVTTDIDRDIKSTCALTWDDPTIIGAYDWAAVFVETTAEDGTFDAEQVGLFRFQQPKLTLFDPDVTVDATGEDPVCLLADAIITDTYNINPGTNIQTALIAIIESVGLTRHNIPATDATAIPGGWSWNPGPNVSLLTIANRLCDYMGWYSLYSTRDGRLTTRPFVVITASEPARTYTLDEDAKFVSTLVLSRNDASLRNVVTVTRDDPAKGAPMIGVARNDNPLSPISTVNIGEMGESFSITDVVDQATLDATALTYLQQVSVLVSGQVDVLLDTTLEPHSVVRIIVPDDEPQFADAAGLWLLNATTLGLTASTATTKLTIKRNELGP